MVYHNVIPGMDGCRMPPTQMQRRRPNRRCLKAGAGPCRHVVNPDKSLMVPVGRNECYLSGHRAVRSAPDFLRKRLSPPSPSSGDGPRHDLPSRPFRSCCAGLGWDSTAGSRPAPQCLSPEPGLGATGRSNGHRAGDRMLPRPGDLGDQLPMRLAAPMPGPPALDTGCTATPGAPAAGSPGRGLARMCMCCRPR